MVLWTLREEQGRWRRVSLPSEGVALQDTEGGRWVPLGRARGAHLGAGLAALLPLEERELGCALLVLAPDEDRVRVNDVVPLPVRVLEDDDQIQFAAARYTVRRFAGPPAERLREPLKTPCVRCTAPFVAGDEIIRCPRCTGPHHAGRRGGGRSDLDCGLGYDPACGQCRKQWRRVTGPPGSRR